MSSCSSISVLLSGRRSLFARTRFRTIEISGPNLFCSTLDTALVTAVTHQRESGRGFAFRRAPSDERLPGVERVDEGVVARVQSGGVRVPEPDVHGDQVRVPEA